MPLCNIVQTCAEQVSWAPSDSTLYSEMELPQLKAKAKEGNKHPLCLEQLLFTWDGSKA